MTTGIQSKGTDLSSIFSPYVAGTTKARATGITVAGTDLNALFANIIYGSAVAATGIDSEGADLNTLFCTGASYTLPIDGQTYLSDGVSEGHVPIGEAQGNLLIMMGGGQLGVQTRTINNGGTAFVTNHLYSIPSGMTRFYIAMSITGNTGIGTSSFNSASGYTAIPGTLESFAQLLCTNNTNNGTQYITANFGLYLAAASGSAVWSAAFTGKAETDVSA